MINNNEPNLGKHFMGNLQSVYVKLRNDAEFLAAFRQNPHQALSNAKIELTPEELHMIMEATKNMDDSVLGGRINK